MLTPFPALDRPSIDITPEQVRAVLHGFFIALVWTAALTVTAYRLIRLAASKLRPHAAALLTAIGQQLVAIDQSAAAPELIPAAAPSQTQRRQTSRRPSRRA